ncbi:hypothetical protein [Mammaliicoccus phage vB_MscM-PMS3]|nr:hypothetical protein [Mammaliicoccus phage vB_MscM-PMS3]
MINEIITKIKQALINNQEISIEEHKILLGDEIIHITEEEREDIIEFLQSKGY